MPGLATVVMLAERSSMTNGRGRSGPDRVPFAEHPHPGLCPQQADATRQLQSSLRLHPRSTNCVRLCLSATCVDGQESDPHDARWRAASGYRPRPSGSSVSRCEPSNALLLPAANAVQTGEGTWGGQEREDRRATCLMVPSVVT